ncbi:hypothetical protein [Streptomyces sp. NPDC051776]|uniref:hypothetical protein n=1 Tax=Streptomyces sp. NPDC051776 TaxID=3155414 RepID=UPI003424B087
MTTDLYESGTARRHKRRSRRALPIALALTATALTATVLTATVLTATAVGATGYGIASAGTATTPTGSNSPSGAARPSSTPPPWG